MNKITFAKVLIFFCCLGCVGVDYVDDPMVPPRIEVNTTVVALYPDQTATLEATYFDEYGINRQVDFTWTSSDVSIATVIGGEVHALRLGQTIVQPVFGNTLGPLIVVTVADDPNAVASVEITADKVTLGVGESLTLSARVSNVDGVRIDGKRLEWFSENSSIVSVNSNGVVTGVSIGVAAIHAKTDGIKSNSIDFTVADNFRQGEFVQAGGYDASGSARLYDENGRIKLTLSNDFNTSFALGTFIYLANSTNSSLVRTNGLELGQIFNDGSHNFDVTALSPTVGLNDYRYVVILCKPATVTFGYADLN